MMVAMSRVTIVGAPTSAGAYAPGQEEGPRAMRDAGLLDSLAAGGVEVADVGDVEAFRWAPDPRNPRAANLAAVVDRARQVAALVAAVREDGAVLVLGGDCTIELGTVAGLRDRVGRLGLVYLDLHADLNVPSSVVDGALDWMGVAHLLDVDGAESELAGIGSSRPLLDDDQLVFLGIKPGTEFEQATISRRDLPVVDIDALAADPEGAAGQALGALEGCDAVAVHFDVDLVHFLDAPLAENTDREGVTLEAAATALRRLTADARFRALTVTEFNPLHGAADGSTTRRLVEVLARALS
jgi:arginase